MHCDLDEDAPDELHTQTCVVGAGAAGITLARRLLAAGQDVVLLESGGLDFEAGTCALNAGTSIGQGYYELDHARLRFFGGTTAIWGGRCAELEQIDFQRRPWVPHSGWPIDAADLAPYYAETRRLLDLPDPLPTARDLQASGATLPAFDPDWIRTKLWVFDGRFNRFTFKSCADLRNNPRCTIMTHATVREIVAAAGARNIDHLDVRSLTGRRLIVRARTYVLAAGGIENPRLLLSSRSVMPMGLGNGYDQVGRYFMEHPHARGGRVIGGNAWMLLNAFGRRHRVNGADVGAMLVPGERLQREAGLLNTSLTIAGRRPVDGTESLGMRAYGWIRHARAPTRRSRAVWMRVKQTTQLVLRYSEPLRPWLLHKAGTLDLALVVRAEQAPNFDSRILLSDEVDALGVPRVKLDWRTSRIDVESVAGLVAALDRELRRLGLGEAESAPWLQDETRAWHTDPLISSHPIGGYHHMGTTRMSDSPRTGVTDGEGKVHGLANLYVAGSSLFATAGWANPTQTILALALRTADAISRDSAASPGKHATVTDMRSPAASFIQEIEQATVQLQPETGAPQPARSKPADEVVAG